jgi:DNA-binding transcriptional ArsR family regulator
MFLKRAWGVIAADHRRTEQLTYTLSITRPADAARGDARPARLRPHAIRAKIIDHLANNGASRLSDISGAVGYPRGNIQYHMLALEAASIVRSNIPVSERARFTPYYSLAGEAPR